MQYISVLKDDIDISHEHRYLRLPHPRTGLPQLYLPYTSPDGTQRISEVVKINCSHRRTWFIGTSEIDMIPIIESLTTTSTRFQPLGDLIAQASVDPRFALPEPFSKEPAGAGFNEDISRLLAIKSVRRVFKACCEKKVVAAGPPSPSSSTGDLTPKGETYYCPSTQIIINHLKRKVDHFAAPEQYEKFDHLVRGLGRDGLLETSANTELVELARLKGSIEHLAQYLPATILTALNEQYDFKSLSTYSANRTAAQIAASAPITQSKSEAALKAGVKRKAAPGSRGVESLKKVNTSSMSKLTSFFKPKEGKK